VLVAFTATTAAAQLAATRSLPIVMDADHSEIDLTSNTTIFYGLRITQGATRIAADRAQTSAVTDFADSNWQFSGGVEIDVGTARIRASQATLRFLNHQLVNARVAGDPAQFSDTNAVTGAITEGAAETFDYDLAKDLVRFENNARISDQANEVTGKLLIYNVARQQVLFEGDAATGERVKIVIQPPDEPDEDGNADDDAETPVP
jgi:lipopolysaccharide transport protein LptA